MAKQRKCRKMKKREKNIKGRKKAIERMKEGKRKKGNQEGKKRCNSVESCSINRSLRRTHHIPECK